MDGVAPRNWRQKKAGTHTREIKTETLPEDVQTLLVEMAETISSLNRRVAEVQATVDSIGSLRGKDIYPNMDAVIEQQNAAIESIRLELERRKAA